MFEDSEIPATAGPPSEKPNMKSSALRRALRVILWLAAIAVALLIWYFSAQPADESTAQSDGFIEWVFGIIDPEFAKLSAAERQAEISGLRKLTRKAAHFSIYCALGFFLTAAFTLYAVRGMRPALFGVALAGLYAIFDEIRQSFVPGRSCQVSDMLLDICGAALGAFICVGIGRIVTSVVRRRRAS